MCPVSLLTPSRKQGHPGHWSGPEFSLPLWARMLPRSPVPSSVRSSRSSMGTRALSVWTGLAATTHPLLNGRGSAAAVSNQNPGNSCENFQKAGGMPQDSEPTKALGVLISTAIRVYPQYVVKIKCQFPW